MKVHKLTTVGVDFHSSTGSVASRSALRPYTAECDSIGQAMDQYLSVHGPDRKISRSLMDA